MTSELEYGQGVPVNQTWRGPPRFRTRWVGRVFSVTDFLFQLISHQALFANGHSLGASRRRRITRAHQEGSPQLSVDSGLQLSVGSPFAPSSVVCTHDERKVNVEAQRSPNLLAYGGITEGVCTFSG